MVSVDFEIPQEHIIVFDILLPCIGGKLHIPTLHTYLVATVLVALPKYVSFCFSLFLITL